MCLDRPKIISFQQRQYNENLKAAYAICPHPATFEFRRKLFYVNPGPVKLD